MLMALPVGQASAQALTEAFEKTAVAITGGAVAAVAMLASSCVPTLRADRAHRSACRSRPISPGK
jgi:hypothetical protein